MSLFIVSILLQLMAVTWIVIGDVQVQLQSTEVTSSGIFGDSDMLGLPVSGIVGAMLASISLSIVPGMIGA
ncbi:hypothetical protein F8M41_015517 [Gigaspora margarita]|uniref:Uncharacterized protein n=1 Tax=Gigaspora margarita TaxID=4874 RepID=A0A8H3WVE9_GIGMA|nr:hypothetical protein F8M41_015517 [Gigaspora margarita]